MKYHLFKVVGLWFQVGHGQICQVPLVPIASCQCNRVNEGLSSLDVEKGDSCLDS